MSGFRTARHVAATRQSAAISFSKLNFLSSEALAEEDGISPFSRKRTP